MASNAILPGVQSRKSHSKSTSPSDSEASFHSLIFLLPSPVPSYIYTGTMEFPVKHRERETVLKKPQGNGPVTNGTIESRIPHTPERDLPGGANWVVQKFGGTSVGKFAVKIAEDIVV